MESKNTLHLLPAMATTHYAAEHDSSTIDSVASSPCSDHPLSATNRAYDDTTVVQARLRFMCSFGGQILPRPHDNQLRYVGGDTRMITVHRHSTTFSSLLNKLSKLSGTPDINVKYQLPNEDLDALITVTGDEDVENMIDEYDRLAHSHTTARLRLFLFPTDASLSRVSSISSLLDGSIKREHWFLDALNGGGRLERGRSEVSSIVSEVPDYLFGLDHPDDPKQKTRPINNDNVSFSDPGSPAPRISSPYCSTSSALGPALIPPGPNLRPVRTRPETPTPPSTELKDPITTETSDPVVLKPTDYPGQPVYYIRQTASSGPVHDMPVYYMSNPCSVPFESGPGQAGPIRPQYVPQFRTHMGQMGQMLHHQVPNMSQVYGGGGGMRPVGSSGESYDMSGRGNDGSTQPVYYGPRYVGVPGYPGMMFTGGEEIKQPGSATKMGRGP